MIKNKEEITKEIDDYWENGKSVTSVLFLMWISDKLKEKNPILFNELSKEENQKLLKLFDVHFMYLFEHTHDLLIRVLSEKKLKEFNYNVQNLCECYMAEIIPVIKHIFDKIINVFGETKDLPILKLSKDEFKLKLLKSNQDFNKKLANRMSFFELLNLLADVFIEHLKYSIDKTVH